MALEDENKRLQEVVISKASRIRTVDESGATDERIKSLEDTSKKIQEDIVDTMYTTQAMYATTIIALAGKQQFILEHVLEFEPIQKE